MRGANEYSDGLTPPLVPVASGAAVGALLALPTLFLALMSSGAGHGDYVAARALFPAPMLLTLLEGSIGIISLAMAVLQFPFYGGLLGWTHARRSYRPAAIVGSLHLVATILCFSGALPYFS